jgi:hypothetical protein
MENMSDFYAMLRQSDAVYFYKNGKTIKVESNKPIPLFFVCEPDASGKMTKVREVTGEEVQQILRGEGI